MGALDCRSRRLAASPVFFFTDLQPIFHDLGDRFIYCFSAFSEGRFSARAGFEAAYPCRPRHLARRGALGHIDGGIDWSDVLRRHIHAFFRLSLSASLSRCAGALLAAIAASTIEEIFFRGIFFKGLRDDLGRLRGYLSASLLFSAIHFVRPAYDTILIDADPWAGVRHLASSFHPFLDPGTFLPGLFGLFLIGVTLCYAFERTGTLYLSIGLHAGWIFGLKTIRVFGDYARTDLSWAFGSSNPKIVSGLATWIGIVLVGLMVHQLTLNRTRLLPDRLALILPGKSESLHVSRENDLHERSSLFSRCKVWLSSCW